MRFSLLCSPSECCATTSSSQRLDAAQNFRALGVQRRSGDHVIDGTEADSFWGRFVPVGEAGAGHALAQAALFEEIFLQPAELLVNEVVGLMNQADGNVGDH